MLHEGACSFVEQADFVRKMLILLDVNEDVVYSAIRHLYLDYDKYPDMFLHDNLSDHLWGAFVYSKLIDNKHGENYISQSDDLGKILQHHQEHRFHEPYFNDYAALVVELKNWLRKQSGAIGG